MEKEGEWSYGTTFYLPCCFFVEENESEEFQTFLKMFDAFSQQESD